MKKGDTYTGRESGLCLKIKDTKTKGVTVVAQRRIVDRKTGEIRIEERERDVPNHLLEYLLMGYDKD